MGNPSVSIVIPVLNQSGYTVQCFESIRLNTGLPTEVIWVDNGSQTHEIEIIRRQASRLSNCKVILNKENLGFIRATNQGIKEATGDYVILLNNDTRVTRGWDITLIKPLMHYPGVGAVGPVTFNSAWQTPYGIQQNLGVELPTGHANKQDFIHSLSKLKDKYVQLEKMSLSFFCVAMRRALFTEIGPLCEELSIGLGDDDEFCLRMRSYGYNILLSLGTFIHHVHRATFSELNIGTESLRKYNMKIIRKKYPVS